jgi:5,10-methylenetetrahydrofolate reductase
VGAITIFEREDEVERVCRKIKAGANFLISQITFHPGRVREFTRALTKKCYEKNLKYPPLYVSVAPIYGRRDVELLNWMDVDVPSDVPDISSLVEEMAKIPGVSGINYEHIRYTNLKRLYDLRPPP